jgi:hypothetical protein
MSHGPGLLLTAVLVVGLSGLSACGSEGPLAEGPARATAGSDAAGDSPGGTTVPTGPVTGSTIASSVSSASAASAVPATSAGSSATGPVSQSPVAAPRPTGLRTRLLSAGALPRFNPDLGWRVASTGPESSAFGVCQKTSLTTIGATRAVVRTYVPASGAARPKAAQVVASFADSSSAWRAYQVLKSWRGQCPDLNDYPLEEVSALSRVTVSAGVGHRFLMAYGQDPAGGEANLVGFGLARRGRFVSIVQFRTVGQDYDFAPGREPESRAVRRIVELLG